MIKFLDIRKNLRSNTIKLLNIRKKLRSKTRKFLDIRIKSAVMEKKSVLFIMKASNKSATKRKKSAN